MITFNRRFNGAFVPENLWGVTFNGEDGAHQFIITGVPTGTVTAYMMRADGTTCTVDGTNDGGTATVTLNQDCYNVPGRFTLSIFVGDTGARVCVYACVGTVYRTRTETIIDSGDVVPSLDDIIAKQAELAQDVADASSAVESVQNAVSYLAPGFSTSKTYKVGEYVTQNGALYICTTAVETAGAWDATNWQDVTFGGELADQKSALGKDEITSLLLADPIPDTVQAIAFDASGNVQTITHSRDGATVRTDAFVFADGSIKETRTLATGESLTIVTNTDTLVTTSTYAEETA